MKKPPYPRPLQLSDPCYDFRPESLRALLAVPDEKLEWHHYNDLLGPHLPAGTYEEVVYFLPGALETPRQKEEDALDLTSAVVGFISKNSTQLEADGLLQTSREGLVDCLRYWTQVFKIVHFDEEACRKKEWKLSYMDYVQNTEAVCETLTQLDRFEIHGDLADQFLMEIADREAGPTQSAWFLELVRAQTDVYFPPIHRPAFQTLFSDTNLLHEKRDVVEKSSLKQADSPTYWRDTFELIRIAK